MSIIDRLLGRPESTSDAERNANAVAAKRLLDDGYGYQTPGYAYGFPLMPWEPSIDAWFRGPDSATRVSPSTSLTHDAVWACVRVLSEDMASLPLIIYRRTGSGKERSQDHPLYEVLHDFANPDMTAFQWRETMMGHVLTWGNCYSEKVYDRAGRLQLWPIRPDRVEPYWDSRGRRAYKYIHPTDGRKELDPDTVFHVSGLGFDGLMGYSPIRMLRETIGEGMHARTFASNRWRTGIPPTVLWEVPPEWDDTKRKNFLDSQKEKREGPNAKMQGVLPPGVKPTILNLPLEDQQFLETRMANRTLIAGAFRVPPDKIGDLEHATYSNIEQQDLNYAKYSLRPWCVRFEMAVRLQLMREDRDHFAEFLLDAILRGDTLSRSQANQIQLRSGVLLPDEWRAMENRNPLAEGMGDQPFISADMGPMAVAAEPTDPLALPELQPAAANGNGKASALAAAENAAIDQRIAALRERDKR